MSSGEVCNIKYGKMNIINNGKQNEIKYVFIPKGYFKNVNSTCELKIKNIYDALNIKIPDMIFKVPASTWPSEYFIHDISYNFDMSFMEAVTEYNLEPLINVNDIKNKFSVEENSPELLWNFKLNQYLINELDKHKNRKNKLGDEKSNNFLVTLKKIEHERALIKDKLKKIIRRLSDVFNQANAILWMKHKKNDFCGDFIAKNCHKSTTIIGDCVLDNNFIIDQSNICEKILDPYINSNDKDKRIELSSKFFTKELYEKIKNNCKTYNTNYQNTIQPLDIVAEDEIKKLEDLCNEYLKLKLNSDSDSDISGNVNLKKLEDKMLNKEHILVRSYASNFDQICNFQMIPKNSITHLIYWEDESDFLSWNSYLKDFFPVGILLIGCKKAGLRHVEDCLKERLPIFVFDKTGGTASIISKIIKKDEDKNKNLKKKSNNCSFPCNIICRSNSRQVSSNITSNTQNNDSSGIFLGQNRKYCLDEKEFENIERSSQIIFEDWTKYYNKNSVYVINPFEDNIERLQDQVNKTMNTAFDYDLELGSENDDRIRLKYAWIQFETLKQNAKRLKFISLCYFIIIGISIFATSVVSTLNSIYKLYYINVSAIILPIFTGILLTLFYTFKPVQRWATSEIGRRMIIGEIYKFRTRTGIYHVSMKCSNKRNKEGKARELFSEELIKIWKNLELSDFKLSSLRTISDNRLKSLIEKQKTEENNLIQATSYEIDIEMAVLEKSSKHLDPLGKMSVEDYVKVRLDNIITKNKNKAPGIERTVKSLQIIIFILTASGAFLTHINLSIFVPNVLALATMISTIMDQEQLIVKLSSTNGIYMQLEQLKCYWQGLCTVDKRKSSNSNYIVENTESILISQLSSYVQAVKSVNEKDDD